MSPAVWVLRHFTEWQRSHLIKFQNGEQALLMVAGMPTPSVKLVHVLFGGVIPWTTIWEYNPTRAGGFSDYIHNLKTMFSVATEGSDDSLNRIRDTLVRCRSIEDARLLFLERERVANSSANEFAHDFTRRGSRSDTSNDDWELGNLSPRRASSPEKVKVSPSPGRYRISADARGKVLTCVEAPTVGVRAERRIRISAKKARHYPAGSIFLDGAAQGEPFVEAQKEIYNLDHPERCLRSLATCEQAILLIRQLADLRRRNWVVLANDTDLDTILAIWVILNHLRLNNDPQLRAKVMPLLRLEGVIDAHGADAQYLSALPPDLLLSTSTMLKQLRQQEMVFKQYGRWAENDILEYIADRLRAIDDLIYSSEIFAGMHEIDELARAEIAGGSVAVICRSEANINQVEQQLQKTYGERLGILLFQDGSSTYTVRQVNQTLPALLERAYERLNLLDPAVKGRSQNCWAGSNTIGASPRKTGTGLNPTEIIDAVREAFRATTIVDVVSEIPRAIFLAVTALLPAVLLILFGNLLREHGYIEAQPVFLYAVVLTATVGIVFWLKALRVSGLYGWRVPTGFRWLVTLPAALVGAVIGGVWAPGSLGYGTAPHSAYEFAASAALFFPVAAELLFRGVILGHLAARLPIQKSGGSWWGSWPTLISSLLYAAASLVLFLSFSNGQLISNQCFLMVAGALTFGIASGMARERSDSVLSSVLLHLLCAAALSLFGNFLC